MCAAHDIGSMSSQILTLSPAEGQGFGKEAPKAAPRDLPLPPFALEWDPSRSVDPTSLPLEDTHAVDVLLIG